MFTQLGKSPEKKVYIVREWFSFHNIIRRKITRDVAVLRFFPSTVGQKWLNIEIAENFMKNIGILRCEEVRS